MWPFKKWAHFKLVLLCCSLVHLANKPVLGEEVQGRVVTPPCLCGLGKRKRRNLSNGQGSPFLWMQPHTLTLCCWVFIGAGAMGQVRDSGEGCSSLVARHSQGTALVQLRAQLYRETWESPREIVHFCCCCCLHQNMRSLWPSVLSIKSLLVCAVSYDTNTVKV